MKILVINGPNLNMLGIRERALYGEKSYEALEQALYAWGQAYGAEVTVFQSNHEGALIDRIQQAYGREDAIIINAGGYTHTSVALLDALKAVNLPCAEVHLTDISAREDFRRISFVGMACEKHFIGMGFEGYHAAIRYLTGKEE